MQVSDSMTLHVQREYRKAELSRTQSMMKVSTNNKILKNSDDPSGAAISQGFINESKIAEAAERNIRNIQGQIATMNGFLEQIEQSVHRLNEIAVSSNDGSKSLADLQTCLDVEFQELLENISQTAHVIAKYNKVPLAGIDQALMYNADKKTFSFSYLDGTGQYDLSIPMYDGLKSENGIDFRMNDTSEFALSADGRQIFYINQDNYLATYEIATGQLILSDSPKATSTYLQVDLQDNLWFAEETYPFSGQFQIGKHDIATWKQDLNKNPANFITDLKSPEFKVYHDKVHYVNLDNQFVTRQVNNTQNFEVQFDLNKLSEPLNLTKGQFAISPDGRYITDFSSYDRNLRIIDTESKKEFKTQIAQSDISSLSFSTDNHELVFIDKNTNTPYSVSLVRRQENLDIGKSQIIESVSGAKGYTGISVTGGSHKACTQVQIGSGSMQFSNMQTIDLRLTALGLARLSVASPERATHALGKIKEAVAMLSHQKTQIGVCESNFIKHSESLSTYQYGLDTGIDVIRKADLAEEITNITQKTIQIESTLSIIKQTWELHETLMKYLG